MNEIENAIESIYSRRDQMENRISVLENRNFEITQAEENKDRKNEN